MSEMTSKERIETVISGGIPDRVPATVHQWQEYHYRNIMECESELDAFQKAKLDAVIYPWQHLANRKHPDLKEYRDVLPEKDGMTEIQTRIVTPDGELCGKEIQTAYTCSTTEYMFKCQEDIYLYEKYWNVPEFDIDAVIAMKKLLGNCGILRGITNGPQGSPWQDACCLYGTETMIYFSFDNPDWTHKCLEILLQKKLEFYRKSLRQLKGVFSMIETGGGTASNTVISPDMFQKFCLPYDKRQHDEIHNLDPDIAISYHTCGGMMQLLDLIPQNGCDFSETLSPPGCGGDIQNYQDETKVKCSLGKKVMLMGGIDQAEILQKGTREEIFSEVERCFNAYGTDGGYIMMPSDHFFFAPEENIMHYSQAVKEVCKY